MQPPEAHRATLLEWFDRAARDLPWRRTRDPYAIWVSEVMLQQTRVETVLRYWRPWLERFATVESLAAAPVDEVLHAWQGLGYYRRARNLHAGARFVVEQLGGLPASAEAWRSVPGVGPYTAGAIASIAFGEPVAAVDGNVIRVLSRWLALHDDVTTRAGRAGLDAEAQRWLSPGRAGDWTQALMELGATVCTPTGPACGQCPARAWCRAASQGSPERFPVKPARKEQRPEQRFALVVSAPDGRELWCRRPDDGLLAGLWEYPLVEASTADEALALLPGLHGVSATAAGPGAKVEHVFTHIRLTAQLVPAVASTTPPPLPGSYAEARWVHPGEAAALARSRLMQKLRAAASPAGR
jgi:A/G-specific adenine glycosylase